MEHSIIMLVALVLLIVFAGFQFQKVLALFRTESEAPSPVAIKTVVKAESVVEPKTKKVVSKKGKTTSKTATKKSEAKRTVAKKNGKTATKKKAVNKK